MQTAVNTLPLLETLKRIRKTVLSGLIAQQSVLAVFLSVLGVYFVVASDSRNYVAF